jgi:hypothetical protein
VARASFWGAVFTISLGILIVLGSRNLAHFDAALAGPDAAMTEPAPQPAGLPAMHPAYFALVTGIKGQAARATHLQYHPSRPSGSLCPCP